MKGSYHQIFLRWLLLITVILFLIYLLWDLNILTAMLAADRTWICVIISVLFLMTSIHCGWRSIVISREHKTLVQIRHNLRLNPSDEINVIDLSAEQTKAVSAVARYFFHSIRSDAADPDSLQAEVLTEVLRGQHQTGWFITGLAIKLGLLGTVIGFGLMLGSVSNIESLEISNMEILMQNMTQGMGIALNTTMFGLVCSMFLGIQYLYLDRSADNVTLDTINFAQKMKLAVEPQESSNQ